MDVGEFLFSAPRISTAGNSAESIRFASRLEAHVMAFPEGAAWKPFHHALGISGHEVYFDHLDELFHSLSLARSMFTGAAFIERRPASELAGYLDVPWCKGDLYFIEKSVYALWAAGARPWKTL